MKKEAFLYSKLVFPVLRLHASAETHDMSSVWNSFVAFNL